MFLKAFSTFIVFKWVGVQRTIEIGHLLPRSVGRSAVQLLSLRAPSPSLLVPPPRLLVTQTRMVPAEGTLCSS